MNFQEVSLITGIVLMAFGKVKWGFLLLIMSIISGMTAILLR